MAFYSTHIRVAAEQFFIQERRKIHESLNSNIFEKIVKYGSEGSYTSPLNRLKINYDLSKLRENSDYEEAKAHWEQDLKNVGTDPEEIETQAGGLNGDIEKFFSENVREYVISAIKENFVPFADAGTAPPNHVSIPYIIEELERDWIEDTGVDTRYHKESGAYHLGGQLIATIPQESEVKLNRLISTLRSKDSPIKSAVRSFRVRRTSILREIKRLNNEIDKRIINPTKKGRYKTTCERCNVSAISPKP